MIDVELAKKHITTLDEALKGPHSHWQQLPLLGSAQFDANHFRLRLALTTVQKPARLLSLSVPGLVNVRTIPTYLAFRRWDNLIDGDEATEDIDHYLATIIDIVTTGDSDLPEVTAQKDVSLLTPFFSLFADNREQYGRVRKLTALGIRDMLTDPIRAQKREIPQDSEQLESIMATNLVTFHELLYAGLGLDIRPSTGNTPVDKSAYDFSIAQATVQSLRDEDLEKDILAGLYNFPLESTGELDTGQLTRLGLQANYTFRNWAYRSLASAAHKSQIFRAQLRAYPLRRRFPASLLTAEFQKKATTLSESYNPNTGKS